MHSDMCDADYKSLEILQCRLHLAPTKWVKFAVLMVLHFNIIDDEAYSYL